jgi:hypothetical protein
MKMANSWMTACIIVLNPEDARQIDYVLIMLRASGFVINDSSVNRSCGVIEDAVAESCIVAGLEKSKLFSYIRHTMSYIAND